MRLLRRGAKKKETKIQTSDSETVFTHVLDIHNLSQSFSESYEKNPQKSKKKRKNKKKNCKHDDPDTSISSLTSWERRIVETEQRVRSILRKVASQDFEYEEDGSSRMDEYNRVKQRAKLTTSHGLLVFDGLVEDIPDDKSLQKFLHEEQENMAVQYYDYDHDNLKHRNRGNRHNDEDPTTTKFISAPQDYDPYVTGFINPKSSEFYESDEDEDESRDTLSYSTSAESHVLTEASSNNISSENITVALSFALKGKNRFGLKGKKIRSVLKEQENFEPSVEVVINERSPLWTL